jgi:cysteine desulfurase
MTPASLIVVAIVTSLTVVLLSVDRPPAPPLPPPHLYFDNNATTRIHPLALDAMIRTYRHAFANPSSFQCTAGRNARHSLHDSRQRLASLVGVRDCHHLVFVSGATEGNNTAILGRLRRHRALHPGSPAHVLVTPTEHASVSVTLHHGNVDVPMELEVLPVDQYGIVCRSELQRRIRDDTALVCVIMANNEIGSVQPDVQALAAMCRASGAHFHCDMTQVVGKYPVDLEALGVDTAVMSAHKFGGPRGVGALYVRDFGNLEPIVHGGGQERGWRSGTENVAGVAAMAVALEVATAAMPTETPRIRGLADGVRQALLSGIPGAVSLGHPRHRLYNTVAVSLPVDSRQLMCHLDGDGICVSAGSACTRSGDSHTLKALGLSEAARRGSLRISLWYDNTARECDYLVSRILHHVRKAQAAS